MHGPSQEIQMIPIRAARAEHQGTHPLFRSHKRQFGDARVSSWIFADAHGLASVATIIPNDQLKVVQLHIRKRCLRPYDSAVKRQAFNLATALSVILLLALLALVLTRHHGRLFPLGDLDKPVTGPQLWMAYRSDYSLSAGIIWTDYDSNAYLHWHGFAYEVLAMYDGITRIGTIQTAAAPIWFPILLTLILPAVRYRMWRHDQQLKRKGLCKICGYDLRASPDRCPECGTSISRIEDAGVKSEVC